MEACQKKKHCKFHGSPQFYGLGASGVGDASGTSSYHSSTASSYAPISSDPCPKRRKIVEVAYKCRPCKSAPAAPAGAAASSTTIPKVLFNLLEFIGRTMGHVNWRNKFRIRIRNITYTYSTIHARSTKQSRRPPESTHKRPVERFERVLASSGLWLLGWVSNTHPPLLPTHSLPRRCPTKYCCNRSQAAARLVPRPVSRPGPGLVPIADSKFSELSCVPQIQSGGMEKALALGRALTSPLAVPVRYSPKGPEANRMRTQSVSLSVCLCVCWQLCSLPLPQQSNRI